MDKAIALVEVRLEADNEADQPSLIAAVYSVVQEMPGAGSRIDQESGELLLSGTSEQNLDFVVERLKSQTVAFNVGGPQVAYHEALVGVVEVEHTAKSRTQGDDWSAHVKLRLERDKDCPDNQFFSALPADSLPDDVSQGIENAVRTVWTSGVLIAFPIVEMKVTLVEATSDQAIPSADAFELATRSAMRKGLDRTRMVLLEPIMLVLIDAPDELVGRITVDLSGRRGEVLSSIRHSHETEISAHVPLAQLFGYFNTLSTLSKGQASSSMSFSHYAEVPRNGGRDPDNFPPAVGMRA